MSELPILRLEAFFEHPKAPHIGLHRGARGAVVGNLRRALRALQCADFSPNLPHSSPEDDVFDEALERAVRSFQIWQKHPNVDGVLGPGTRRRLARATWDRLGPRFLTILENSRPDPRPRAFLSHSSSDTAAVEQVEAYLHDNSVNVVRYTHSFVPGHTISDEIKLAVARADNVIVFQSAAAVTSKWVLQEIELTEELERAIDRYILIYVLLAAAKAAALQERIVVHAAGRKLRDVGNDLLRALKGPGRPSPQSYDADARL